ncbi:hypothetical protein [Nocardia callitridis]|uniref:hypothetical protein n=1 Tax=Nocardia callitridis TaxID=648753 RepID=UPI0031EA9577
MTEIGAGRPGDRGGEGGGVDVELAAQRNGGGAARDAAQGACGGIVPISAA